MPRMAADNGCIGSQAIATMGVVCLSDQLIALPYDKEEEEEEEEEEGEEESISSVGFE